jgi:acetyltransferase
LIGVSDRPGNLGAIVLGNLRAGSFGGPIWLVNPRHGSVAGQTAWPTIDALPGVPDLAVVCTPAAAVPEVIDALGRKGTRAAAVLTAGLKVAAAAGGPTLEAAMLDAARPHLLRILGPNCLGLLVPGVGLNASFAPGNASNGKLAFITQSGALATAMLDWAGNHGVGFSHYVSLGDCADIDFGDVLDYLAADEGTRAILMYMESVKGARKFLSAARAAARNKPVIVVKAGRAPAGAKAAASHTGALAGSDTVFDAAVKRAGMLRVDSLASLFDAAETLAYVKPWRGERLVVLTNGGGAGVLAADALAMCGGELAELSASTLDALDRWLPPTWPRSNPVDIIGDAPVARYCDALRTLLAAPEVDGVLFLHAPTAVVPAGDIAAAVLPLMQSADKPVLASWLGGRSVASARQACTEAEVPHYFTPERAVAAWMQKVVYARNQDALLQLPAAQLDDFRPDLTCAMRLVEEALLRNGEWLDEESVRGLLGAYGIPVIESHDVADPQGAAAAVM